MDKCTNSYLNDGVFRVNFYWVVLDTTQTTQSSTQTTQSIPLTGFDKAVIEIIEKMVNSYEILCRSYRL